MKINDCEMKMQEHEMQLHKHLNHLYQARKQSDAIASHIFSFTFFSKLFNCLIVYCLLLRRVDALSGLLNLTHLDISHNPVASLDSLNALVNLTTLGLDDDDDANIVAIKNKKIPALHLRRYYTQHNSTTIHLTNEST